MFILNGSAVVGSDLLLHWTQLKVERIWLWVGSVFQKKKNLLFFSRCGFELVDPNQIQPKSISKSNPNHNLLLEIELRLLEMTAPVGDIIKGKDKARGEGGGEIGSILQREEKARSRARVFWVKRMICGLVKMKVGLLLLLMEVGLRWGN